MERWDLLPPHFLSSSAAGHLSLPVMAALGPAGKGDHPQLCFHGNWWGPPVLQPGRGVPPGEDQQDDLSLKPPGLGWGLHVCLSLFP